MNIGGIFPVSVPGPNDPGMPGSGDGAAEAFAALLSFLVPGRGAAEEGGETSDGSGTAVATVEAEEDEVPGDDVAAVVASTAVAVAPTPVGTAVIPEKSVTGGFLASSEAATASDAVPAGVQASTSDSADGDFTGQVVRALREAVSAPAVSETAPVAADVKDVDHAVAEPIGESSAMEPMIDAETVAIRVGRIVQAVVAGAPAGVDVVKSMPTGDVDRSEADSGTGEASVAGSADGTGIELGAEVAAEYSGDDNERESTDGGNESPVATLEVKEGPPRSATVDAVASPRVELRQPSSPAAPVSGNAEVGSSQRPNAELPKMGQPTSHATVRMDVGGSEARVRVAVRGETVTATVTVDAADAPLLSSRIDELKQGLREQGFQEARVVIRSVESADAVSGQRIGVALDDIRQRSGELRMERSGGSDQREETGNERSAPERERQQRRSNREKKETA